MRSRHPALRRRPPTPSARPGSDAAEAAVDALFEDGRRLLADGDFAQACAKFSDALKHDSDAAGVMFNLGLCSEPTRQARDGARLVSAGERAQLRAALVADRGGGQDRWRSSRRASRRWDRVLAPAARGLDRERHGERIPDVEYTRHEVDPGPHEIELKMPGKPSVIDKVDRGQSAGPHHLIGIDIQNWWTGSTAGPPHSAPPSKPGKTTVCLSTRGGRTGRRCESR